MNFQGEEKKKTLHGFCRDWVDDEIGRVGLDGACCCRRTDDMGKIGSLESIRRKKEEKFGGGTKR